MQVLRDYQERALEQLRELIRGGRQRLLLVAPTGAGKTTIAAAMIRGAESKGIGTLFLAHRKELIDQCSARLDEHGVDHGIVMSGHPRALPDLSVQIASVQTLVRRERKPDAGLVIVDEAHHARAGTYQQILDCYPSAAVVGLSATPWRTDGRGLGELFEDMVVAARPRELIEAGHLVPYTGYAYDVPQLGEVKRRHGDYDERGLQLVMGSNQLVGNMVKEWLEHAKGQRTVVFTVGVDHSLSVVERFKEAGATAEHLDGTTPTLERERILERLRTGETRIVSNVGVLTEGWDMPNLEVCILARPTLSAGLYLQQVGRVLRPAPGKLVGRIHDHAGCILQHGPPDLDRDYSLDLDARKRSGAPKPPPLRTCKYCLRVWDPKIDGEACPGCGQEPEREARKLREVEAAEAIPLETIRQPSPASEMVKAAFLVKMQRLGESKGYKPGWAAVRFKLRFGHWPRKLAAGAAQ